MKPTRCAGCGKTPSQLPDYKIPAEAEGVTPEEYVWNEEGTLNRETGSFLCDTCYVDHGMPSTQGGWTA